jgi:hypothetical protein
MVDLKADPTASRRWIGVDLDGTLVHDCTTPDQVWTIGAPIPRMIDKVKQWLADGIDVRIFTARVGCCGETSTIATDDQAFVDYQRRLIADWCVETFGRVLPVTATKDFQMIRYYDDRGIQMVTNTGESIAERYDALLQQIRDLLAV